MSIKTIRSLLCATEESRQYLWYLFFAYTFLINHLLEELPKDAKFSNWREKGRIPRKAIVAAYKQILKKDESLKGLPARFYTSAVLSTAYTFASIFAIQNKLHIKCEGKQRWLSVAEKDLELAETTDFSSDAIREKAAQILGQAESERQEEGRKKNKQPSQPPSTMSILFKILDKTKDLLSYRAIAHLLRNDCKVNFEEEDPEKLALRLSKKRIQIERLQEQLNSQLPIGRDPLGDRTEQFIEDAIAFADHFAFIPTQFWLKWHKLLLDAQPSNTTKLDLWFLSWAYYRLNTTAEFDDWEQSLPKRTANLSTQLNSLPYPLLFGSNDDLRWLWESETKSSQSAATVAQRTTLKSLTKQKSKRIRTRQRKKQAKSRICVSFRGKGLSHLRFRIYCDRRQLPIFRQLVKESEANKGRKKEDKFSLALSPLRSAGLMWVKDPQQLHKKNHWKLKNLWLKWFCEMPNKDIPAKTWEQWFHSLVYLRLSQELPWKTHRLYLHAAIDPRLLTAEGTEVVRQEKITLMGKFLKGLEEADEMQAIEAPGEEEQAELLVAKKNRASSTKRNQTSLTRLQNNSPPPRPSRVAYQGNPKIAVQVAFSREHIVGVAVSDGHYPIIDYRDVSSLLVDSRVKLLEQRSLKLRNQPERLRKVKLADSKKDTKAKRTQYKPKISARQLQLQPYRLLKRWRRLKHKNLLERQAEQKHGLYRQSQAESNLAQYINRLLARNIVDLCQKWSAGSIILPEFGDLREIIESEIQAKAKRKYPDDDVERQKQYAKEFRMTFHRWNYKHLSECICSRAAKVGITCVAGRQPRLGTLREKAIAVTAIPPKPK